MGTFKRCEIDATWSGWLVRRNIDTWAISRIISRENSWLPFQQSLSGGIMRPLITWMNCKPVFIVYRFSKVIFSYYGGWVCPNIYYLGHSGVIRFGGLRIAGISGIYNPHHYQLGYYEREPMNGSMIRSAYHYREFEIKKLQSVNWLCNLETISYFIIFSWKNRWIFS